MGFNLSLAIYPSKTGTIYMESAVDRKFDRVSTALPAALWGALLRLATTL